jgi:methylenetetrahydrofolate reductase (NADPH)
MVLRVRYEVIPLRDTFATVVDHVPPDVPVTITASAQRGMDPTIALALRLAARGFDVVPHLAARMIRDATQLRDMVTRLGSAGVRDVFVIAGDSAHAAGPYAGAGDLLAALAELRHPFSRVGIAGYPEGHPFLNDDILDAALQAKSRHATYMVSQACFDARPLLRWLRRVRQLGVGLPLFVGLVGIVERRKLLRIAARMGVGPSLRFVARQRGWLWRPLLRRSYDPTSFIGSVAAARADGIVGLNVFTFNAVARTEAWRQSQLSSRSATGSAVRPASTH